MKENTKKKVIKICWLVVFAPFAILILMLLGVGIFAKIPSFEELEDPKSALSTVLISEEGDIINNFHVENRSFVTYDDLPIDLVHAAVATEDARFYSHSGIDFKSLVRVGVKTILMGNARSGGGGSTITQQLAKTLFPRDSVSSNFPGSAQFKLVVNKLKEWITAVKLERNYTKDEIITMYMNAVFFGSNAYGIKVAANTFFDKDPIQLTIEEGATLVGIINKPTRFNPVVNYDKSLARRNHVISQMNKYGYITESVKDSLVQLPIVLSFQQQDHNTGLAPYFRDMLKRVMNADYPNRNSYYFEEDYLEALRLWEEDPLYGWLNKNFKADGSKYNLDKDGLKIYTTINAKMQKYAEEAVEEHLSKDLQQSFFKDMKWKKNRPFAVDVPNDIINKLMSQARRWSDRYRNMKESSASESEILESFNVKTKMRVFSWNRQGYVDTIMTPNDSIRYYKSFLRAGFIAMEPQTGNVRAYVGGPNYRYFKYDNARQSKRQVGSTIKPFLYTLAMQEGYTPCDKVLNVPQSFLVGDTTWTPKSTDKAEWIGQTVTLKWGLTKSSNNISAYLMKQFGPQAMVNMCRKLGISTYLAAVPSLCVGSAEVTLMEMVGAYNTYPNRGVHIEPIFVTKIEDKEGNVLGNFVARKEESVSEATAYMMVNLMQGVVNDGTAARLRWRYNIEGELSGKTGTTNDQADGWFIGYTPTLTAGVWVGAEDRQIHFESLSLGGGANMALPIWGIFMNKVIKDGTLGVTPNDTFFAPPGLQLNLNCSGGDEDAVKKNDIDDNSFFN